MTTVYNHSTCQEERAKWTRCPRCSGFGAVAFTDEDGRCPLCTGYGSLWVSITGSSYVRAKGRQLKNSEMY